MIGRGIRFAFLAPEGIRELVGRNEKGQIGTECRAEFCSSLALFEDKTDCLES